MNTILSRIDKIETSVKELKSFKDKSLGDKNLDSKEERKKAFLKEFKDLKQFSSMVEHVISQIKQSS